MEAMRDGNAEVERLKSEMVNLIQRLPEDLQPALITGRKKLIDLAPEDYIRIKAVLDAAQLNRLAEIPKLIAAKSAEIDRFQLVNDKMMEKRSKYMVDARDELKFFTFYNMNDDEKEPFKNDPIYNYNEHMLFPYGFLGACLDHDQIAIELIYHGDYHVTAKSPVEPREFYTEWLAARRDTMEKIYRSRYPKEGEKLDPDAPSVLTQLKRKTTRIYFWLHSTLLSEFVGKIFQNRAVIMQQCVMDRYERLRADDAENQAPMGNPAQQVDAPEEEEEVSHLADGSAEVTTDPATAIAPLKTVLNDVEAMTAQNSAQTAGPDVLPTATPVEKAESHESPPKSDV
jgi:hypothetical protein